MQPELKQLLKSALAAKKYAASLDEEAQNSLLRAMAAAVLRDEAAILAANEQDLKNAKGRIADVMLDRLRLDAARVGAMADGILSLTALKTPVGLVEGEASLVNGLHMQKVRVPLGVVAIIYESRPNVTADAAALCVKSGNVCVLRGGSDAILTNTAITNALRRALAENGAPSGFVQLVRDTSHESAQQLMSARGYVDLLIPRGGKGLIAAVVTGASGVPVIETGSGICHLYVDKAADLDMADDILYNAKTSRPSVCNAVEVCLVHRDVAAAFLPMAGERLRARNVELRLDPVAAGYITGTPAGPDDFDTEFNDFILAVKVVDSLDDAIDHINAHGTHHSDAIVTADEAAAARFAALVDSAAVYVNASTRFTDGGEFGFGCEMGISTQKLGARGPMGLYELTSYKYVLTGTGQVR